MKTTKDKIITGILTPASWLYGAGVWVRNKLFNAGILREEKFDIPVVGIGNITVGGTGKTPHVEYLAGILSSRMRIAVLSRGYKRHTKGFIIASSKSTPEQIGDEPMQIYLKLGMRVKVAVCESRREGIVQLMKAYPDLQLILLDDSFQHRWVKPSVSVVLLDYNRPVYRDRLLPLGRLREPAHNINRADMVIVTKCPETMSPLDYRLVSKELDLMSYQHLYFSSYDYGGLLPVFPDDSPYQVSLGRLSERDGVLLLTGIAYPRHFVRHFKDYPFNMRVARFPDHHDFTRADIERIRQRFRSLKGERKIIVTTEKDAVRLAFNPYFPKDLKPFTFYLPISVHMREGLDGRDLVADLTEALHLPEFPDLYGSGAAPNL